MGVGEGFVAARNVCVHMVLVITSPGVGVDMLMEFESLIKITRYHLVVLLHDC